MELVPAGHYLYMMHKGVALLNCKVLGTGSAWGVDMILSKAELRSKYSAKALNYLEVHAIDRRGLFELAANYPLSSKAIRFHAVRRTLQSSNRRRARRTGPSCRLPWTHARSLTYAEPASLAVALLRETVRQASEMKRKFATLRQRRESTKQVGRRYKNPKTLSSALEAASSSCNNLTVTPHGMTAVGEDGYPKPAGGSEQVCARRVQEDLLGGLTRW